MNVDYKSISTKHLKQNWHGDESSQTNHAMIKSAQLLHSHNLLMQSHSKSFHSWQSLQTRMPENITLFQNFNSIFKILLALSLNISWHGF